MKFTGNLKNQIEKANSKEEIRKVFENVGIELNKDELEKISGAAVFEPAPDAYWRKLDEEERLRY